MTQVVIRVFDVVISALALILLSPILIMISLMIALRDGAPIFFTQERLGVDGRVFHIIKFRTMRTEPIPALAGFEAVNSYSIKLRRDPRITTIGRFLRATSIDEIPQLVNILLGDMSLVGPRPWVSVEYDRFPEEWSAEDRLAVKPGLTGYAQIQGRSDLAIIDILEKDRLWVKNPTLTAYFGVMFATGMKLVRVILGGRSKGVY